MNQNTLRFKGWISALRPYALSVILLGSFFLIGFIKSYTMAYRAAHSPQVSIGALVRGEIETGSYVTLKGWVFYGGLIEEKEGSKLEAVFNPLVDPVTGDMILVRFTQREVFSREDEEMITVSGLISSPGTDLTEQIEQMLPEIRAAGFNPTTDLYLRDILEPGQPQSLLPGLVGVALAMLVSAVIAVMPRIVFAPHPLTASASPEEGIPKRIRVTGRLNKVNPKASSLELTKRRQHFAKVAVAVLATEKRELVVHYHQVVVNRYMGIKIGTNVSDWAVRLSPIQVVRIEPGKLYSFDERPALRITYKGQPDRESVLVLSFEGDKEQAFFVEMLKELGFSVQWLGYANTI